MEEKLESVRREYGSTLSDLKFNSKPLINTLTTLAEENVSYASEVVRLIESRLQKAPSNEKLPILYLMDSIVKNVKKGPYQQLFAKNLTNNFCGVFSKVNEKTRASLFKLRSTWNQYFASGILHALDVRVQKIDPAWPILAPSTSAPAPAPSTIHINPKFIKKPAPMESTATPTPVHPTPTVVTSELSEKERLEQEMRQSLISKQAELLQIQQQRLELELEQTKARLESQARELAAKSQALEEQQKQITQMAQAPPGIATPIQPASLAPTKPAIVPMGKTEGLGLLGEAPGAKAAGSLLGTVPGVQSTMPLVSQPPVNIPNVSASAGLQSQASRPQINPRDPRLLRDPRLRQAFEQQQQQQQIQQQEQLLLLQQKKQQLQQQQLLEQQQLLGSAGNQPPAGLPSATGPDADASTQPTGGIPASAPPATRTDPPSTLANPPVSAPPGTAAKKVSPSKTGSKSGSPGKKAVVKGKAGTKTGVKLDHLDLSSKANPKEESKKSESKDKEDAKKGKTQENRAAERDASRRNVRQSSRNYRKTKDDKEDKVRTTSRGSRTQSTSDSTEPRSRSRSRSRSPRSGPSSPRSSERRERDRKIGKSSEMKRKDSKENKPEPKEKRKSASPDRPMDIGKLSFKKYEKQDQLPPKKRARLIEKEQQQEAERERERERTNRAIRNRRERERAAGWTRSEPREYHHPGDQRLPRRPSLLDPSIQIPKELSLSKLAKVLEQAEKQLNAGALSHEQHQQLLRELNQIYNLQQQKREEEERFNRRPPQQGWGPPDSLDSQDTRDPRMDPRDPRSDSRDPRSDCRDSRDPRGPRGPHADPRGSRDPRGPRGDPRDTRIDPRDPRGDHRDPRIDPGEPRDPRGPHNDPRDLHSDSRNLRSDPREPHGDQRDPRGDPRMLRDPRAMREPMTSHGPLHGPRDVQDPRAPFDGRGTFDGRSPFDNRDGPPMVDSRPPHHHRDFMARDPRVMQDASGPDPMVGPQNPRIRPLMEDPRHQPVPENPRMNKFAPHPEAIEVGREGPRQHNPGMPSDPRSRIVQPPIENPPVEQSLDPGMDVDERKPVLRKYRGPLDEKLPLPISPRDTDERDLKQFSERGDTDLRKLPHGQDGKLDVDYRVLPAAFQGDVKENIQDVVDTDERQRVKTEDNDKRIPEESEKAKPEEPIKPKEDQEKNQTSQGIIPLEETKKETTKKQLVPKKSGAKAEWEAAAKIIDVDMRQKGKRKKGKKKTDKVEASKPVEIAKPETIQEPEKNQELEKSEKPEQSPASSGSGDGNATDKDDRLKPVEEPAKAEEEPSSGDTSDKKLMDDSIDDMDLPSDDVDLRPPMPRLEGGMPNFESAPNMDHRPREELMDSDYRQQPLMGPGPRHFRGGPSGPSNKWQTWKEEHPDEVSAPHIEEGSEGFHRNDPRHPMHRRPPFRRGSNSRPPFEDDMDPRPPRFRDGPPMDADGRPPPGPWRHRDRVDIPDDGFQPYRRDGPPPLERQNDFRMDDRPHIDRGEFPPNIDDRDPRMMQGRPEQPQGDNFEEFPPNILPADTPRSPDPESHLPPMYYRGPDNERHDARREPKIPSLLDRESPPPFPQDRAPFLPRDGPGFRGPRPEGLMARGPDSLNPRDSPPYQGPRGPRPDMPRSIGPDGPRFMAGPRGPGDGPRFPGNQQGPRGMGPGVRPDGPVRGPNTQLGPRSNTPPMSLPSDMQRQARNGVAGNLPGNVLGGFGNLQQLVQNVSKQVLSNLRNQMTTQQQMQHQVPAQNLIRSALANMGVRGTIPYHVVQAAQNNLLEQMRTVTNIKNINLNNMNSINMMRMLRPQNPNMPNQPMERPPMFQRQRQEQPGIQNRPPFQSGEMPPNSVAGNMQQNAVPPGPNNQGMTRSMPPGGMPQQGGPSQGMPPQRAPNQGGLQRMPQQVLPQQGPQQAMPQGPQGMQQQGGPQQGMPQGTQGMQQQGDLRQGMRQGPQGMQQQRGPQQGMPQGPQEMQPGDPRQGMPQGPQGMQQGGPQQGMQQQGGPQPGDPPQGMPQGPQGMQQGGPKQGIPQGPQGMQQGGPQQGLPQGPQGMQQGGPQQGLPQGPQGMQQGGPQQGMPQGPQGMQQLGGPQGMPQGPQGMQQLEGPQQGMPQGPQGMQQLGGPQGIPQGPQGMQQQGGPQHGMPQGLQGMQQQGGPVQGGPVQGMPQQGMQGMPPQGMRPQGIQQQGMPPTSGLGMLQGIIPGLGSGFGGSQPQAPAPGLSSQLDINSLFSKLISTGILKEPIKPASPHPDSTGPPAAGEKAKEVETDSEKDVDSQEIEDDGIYDIPEISLVNEELKARHPGLIKRMYSGMQCTSCGQRFVIAQMDRYRKHLDWHFRQNRKKQDGIKATTSRKWYYEVDEWLDYEEINDMEDARSTFFDEQAQELADRDQGDSSVPVTSDSSDEICKICREKFEQFFNEDTEDWHFRDAIRVDGKTFHPSCYDDVKDTSGFLETPTDDLLSPPLVRTRNSFSATPVSPGANIALSKPSFIAPGKESWEAVLGTDKKPVIPSTAVEVEPKTEAPLDDSSKATVPVKVKVEPEEPMDFQTGAEDGNSSSGTNIKTEPSVATEKSEPSAVVVKQEPGIDNVPQTIVEKERLRQEESKASLDAFREKSSPVPFLEKVPTEEMQTEPAAPEAVPAESTESEPSEQPAKSPLREGNAEDAKTSASGTPGTTASTDIETQGASVTEEGTVVSSESGETAIEHPSVDDGQPSKRLPLSEAVATLRGAESDPSEPPVLEVEAPIQTIDSVHAESNSQASAPGIFEKLTPPPALTSNESQESKPKAVPAQTPTEDPTVERYSIPTIGTAIPTIGAAISTVGLNFSTFEDDEYVPSYGEDSYIPAAMDGIPPPDHASATSSGYVPDPTLEGPSSSVGYNSQDIVDTYPTNPTLVDPHPNVVSTDPVVSEPNPVVSEPNPVVNESNPAVVDPNPTMHTPNPPANDPNPVVGDSNPTIADPTIGDPKPAEVDPQPTLGDPNPIASDPCPTGGDSNPSLAADAGQTVGNRSTNEGDDVTKVAEPRKSDAS